MGQVELFREHEVVVKANDLIRARANWTALEHRIFAMMVAQIEKSQTEFQPQKIYVKDLKELTATKSENMYGRLLEVCDRLPMSVIGIRDTVNGKRRYRSVSPISKCEYVEGQGYILAKFNDDLQDLLLQLTGNFTMYRLKQYMQLESMYSMRIYELAMMRADISHYRIETDELRAILSCEDKYARFADFKRRTLEMARSEINEKTDISFRYKIERKGRTPTHVHFYITDEAEDEHREMRKALREADESQMSTSSSGSAKSNGSAKAAPNIDVRKLVVDELTPEELDRVTSQEVNTAVQDALAFARENGNKAAGAIASVAYRKALQTLRQSGESAESTAQ